MYTKSTDPDTKIYAASGSTTLATRMMNASLKFSLLKIESEFAALMWQNLLINAIGIKNKKIVVLI